MLLDIPSTEIQAHQRGTFPVAGVLFFCLGLSAFLALWQPVSSSIMAVDPLVFISLNEKNIDQNFHPYSFWNNAREQTSPVANQGIALYGVHPDLQILASLLLLVAMVGAVGLTLKRPVAAPDYDVFAQHYVDFQKVVVQIPEKNLFLSNNKVFQFYTKKFK